MNTPTSYVWMQGPL